MAAKKLAYFGYLNGFNQTELTLGRDWEKKYQPETDFMSLCRQARSNDISNTLQQKLVAFYQAHARRLGALSSNYFYQLDYRFAHQNDDLYLAHKNGFIFGSTYAYFNNVQQMALLDVQNESLITKFMRPGSNYITHPGSTFLRLSVSYNLKAWEDSLNKHLESNNTKGLLGTIYAKSPFAQPTTAQVSIQKIYQAVKRELELWPDLKKEKLQFLTKLNMMFAGSLDKRAPELTLIYDEVYNLTQEQPDLLTPVLLKELIQRCLNIKYYKLASLLLNKLYLFNDNEAIQSAVSRELLPFLESPLKESVASKLIQDAKSKSLVSSLFGRSKAQLYADAAMLNPSIKNQEGAGHFFNVYITNKQWAEAWDLFSEIETDSVLVSQLNPTDRTTLAEYYLAIGNRLYEEGHELRVSDIAQAELKYLESLSMIKRAATLDPSEHNLTELNVHRRLIAQIIVDGEEKKTRVSYERLAEARKYLEEIKNSTHASSDPHFIACFIKTIHYQVKLLHQACLGASINDYIEATAAHRENSKRFLRELMKCLDTLIELRTELLDLTSVEIEQGLNRRALAADYCLKADCINYFELDGDCMFNFKKACELEPNQPFYHLLYSTVGGLRGLDLDGADNKGLELLVKSDVSAVNWRYWYEERWMKESDRIYKVSMPEPVVSPTTSHGSTFKAMFGYS